METARYGARQDEMEKRVADNGVDEMSLRKNLVELAR